MRSYTLAFSVIAHAIAIGALIIVPALATDDLPEVQRTTAFTLVRPEMPQPPAVQAKRREADATSRTAAPVVEPETLQPESAEPAGLPGPDIAGAPLSGVPIGEAVTGGDLIAPPSPARPKDPVHVGGVVQPPTRTVYVAPIYPSIALAARKEGLVILEALIGEDGLVREVRVLRSDRLFDDAAMTAVKQWKFLPTRLNGEPVPLVMTVTVGFTLTR